MKLNDETIIVGGLPKPIGGVTTFLLRLVRKHPEKILKFIDLYPSVEKIVPMDFEDKFVQSQNKLFCIFIIFYYSLFFKKKEIFFNFSSANSLILFLFMPKINNNWSLMLHHGSLKSKYFNFINKLVLNKFDMIYSINERQDLFYKKYVNHEKIKRQISYVPATLEEIDNKYKHELSIAKKLGLKIVIGSGCPKKIYQHDLLIETAKKNKNVFLFLFLYDNGELREKYLKFEHERIKFFFDESEDIFNYYLAKADLYIRPTLEDSFGIACADAIEFGTQVIASDVCTRYKDVLVYNVKSNKELYDLSQCLLQK